MSDDVFHTPKFTIRRVGPAQPPPQTPPEPPAEPPTPESPKRAQKGAQKKGVHKGRSRKRTGKASVAVAPASVPAAASEKLSEPLTAGLFSSARAALAFLGSAFSLSTDYHQANVRGTPNNSWWAEVPAEPDQLVELIWAAGGRPYTRRRGQWQPATPGGRTRGVDAPRPDKWPVLGLGDLLAQVHLPDRTYEPASRVDLVLPGRLARLALQRATALGLRAAMAPVSLRPLAEPDGAAAGAVLIQLRAAARQTVSRSLVHALGNLPYCAVCSAFQLHEAAGQLLLDVRCRLPLPVSLVQAMVPPGQAWLLAPADIGHRQFQPPGELTDCATLLQLPDRFLATAPSTPATELSRPLPVSLVRNPHRNRRVDAVLLDDQELDWLRRYLMTRPLGEDGFLLPGPGRHLLSSPGGLAEALPLGVPLAWIGPYSCYIETGTDFHPSVPPRAREQRFQLGPDTVVAVLREQAYRFDPEQALPLWSLWIGDPPPVDGTISPPGRNLVAHVADILHEQLQQGQPQPDSPRSFMGLFRGKEDVSDLLGKAEKAERRGNFAKAAELYEKAGQHGPAGRLYERAAMALED